MPIKVSCSCGQSFTAKDELKGQTLLCPKCHQPLTIGATAPQDDKQSDGMADLFEEVGLKEFKGQRCPNCGAPLKPKATMCVECGLNLESGERLHGAKIRKVGEQGFGEAADVLLDRAAQTLVEDKAQIKKTLSQGAPAWIYFLGLAIVVAFGAAMLLLPKNQALYHTGTGLIGLGSLIIFVYSIRIMIVAFFDRIWHGLLCLFIPPYMLIYTCMRWNTVGGFFIMQLGGGAVIGLGCALQSISWAITPKDGPTLRSLPAAPSIVFSLPAEELESLPAEELESFQQESNRRNSNKNWGVAKA